MAAQRIPGQNGPAPFAEDPDIAFTSSRQEGIQALQELGVQAFNPESEKGRTIAQGNEQGTEKNLNDEIRGVPEDEEAMPIGKGMTAAEKVSDMSEIALYALHVEDDPSLNPWTFRTWFLGTSWTLVVVSSVTSDNIHRPWSLSILRYSCNDLSVQAARHRAVSHLLVCDKLCAGFGPGADSTNGSAQVVKPTSLQLQGACGHSHHVVHSGSFCNGH